jgi:hypothetical protein
VLTALLTGENEIDDNTLHDACGEVQRALFGLEGSGTMKRSSTFATLDLFETQSVINALGIQIRRIDEMFPCLRRRSAWKCGCYGSAW